MKILSIDVGIKNLAICLFDKPENNTELQILKWDVINIGELSEEIKCGEIDKSLICNKPAKFSKNGKCYCLKHSKKQPYQVPSSDLKPSFINKQKIKNLYELAEKYNINYEEPIKKSDLINLINNYIFEKCFEPIGTTNVNASKINIISIGRNIKTKLDILFKNEIDTITHVIIENQISPIANRMKTIQGMIAQYFIMQNNYINIEFISSSNKLKDCKSDIKNSYSERKKRGIQKCLEILSNNQNYIYWEKMFKEHKKKDDLADSFLQGIWFINNKSV
uniref:Mitochondrial resolvase Ydc2 catalytic domain-containing protein n=1 Tax=viral metagenome TaxID=1070528 RepID=A0A6C0D874_9ZZZZ